LAKQGTPVDSPDQLKTLGVGGNAPDARASSVVQGWQSGITALDGYGTDWHALYPWLVGILHSWFVTATVHSPNNRLRAGLWMALLFTEFLMSLWSNFCTC
jgi:hypothetical protein